MSLGDVIMRAERIFKEYQKYANVQEDDLDKFKNGDEFQNLVEEIKIQSRTLKQASGPGRCIVSCVRGTRRQLLRARRRRVPAQDVPSLCFTASSRNPLVRPQKAQEIAASKNRAMVATMNAELRRSKNQLLTASRMHGQMGPLAGHRCANCPGLLLGGNPKATKGPEARQGHDQGDEGEEGRDGRQART